MKTGILCKIIGHKYKQVEEAEGDVEICSRCRDLKTPRVLGGEEDPTEPNVNEADGRVLYCRRCDSRVTSTSRFEGDSCPICKEGYLEELEEEQQLTETEVDSSDSRSNEGQHPDQTH